MNFSKIIKNLIGLSMFIGFFILLGAVGNVDFADELHEEITFMEFVPQMIIGLILMLPGFYMFQEYEEGEDYE